MTITPSNPPAEAVAVVCAPNGYLCRYLHRVGSDSWRLSDNPDTIRGAGPVDLGESWLPWTGAMRSWFHSLDSEVEFEAVRFTAPKWETIGFDAGFVTKDSGEREEFGNGSVRDTEEGKPRYDLISPVASKRRAELMARGAVKYGERNWELGQPTSRFMSSLMRHVEMYRLGDRSEDHLAAIGYNADAIMHFEGTEWDDVRAPGTPG